MIQKILIKTTDICLIFFLLWFVWYEVSYYNICLPIINMRFDSILGKLVVFFSRKIKNIGILDVYIWLICDDVERRKQHMLSPGFQKKKKKCLFGIFNYRMNHSCKVYYYFNSLINWRHIINKFKYYKKTMLSLTK